MPALSLSVLLCALVYAAGPAETDPSDSDAGIEGPARPPAPAPELIPDPDVVPDPEGDIVPAPAPAPDAEPERALPVPWSTTAPGDPAYDPTHAAEPTPSPPGQSYRRQPGAAPPEEPEEPDEYQDDRRAWEDMPYGATAARKSAVQRNNDVLVRPFGQPIYSIAAAGRFATSLIGGRDVIQPFGFGVGAQLRIHFLRVFKARLGVEVYAGYTRFPERVDYLPVEGSTATITRLDLLAHTDVSAGPSMQIPLGPVFLQFGGSAGVAFSTLSRTQSIEALDDELTVSTDFLLRGGLSLGVPILNRHGLTVGAAVQHVFSRDEVQADLGSPDDLLAQPFGTWLEINLGYQMWF